MNNEHIVVNDDMQKHLCSIKCVCWSAIIVGALVAIGLSFLLEVFSISIGLAAFSPTREGIISLAIGGVIALLFSAIVAMFVAGWVTGYLARPFCSNSNVGVLYGFTTWCLAFVVSVLLASHVNLFITSHYNSLVNPGASNVKLNTNPVSPLIAEQAKANPNTSTANSQSLVNQEKSANLLGLSLFLTFALFFVGAISSCVGGYYGVCRDGSGACRKRV